jgi:hypothetical protein
VTMAICLSHTSEKCVYLAADRRVTLLDQAGRNTGIYHDDCTKIVSINQHAAAFCGGLADAAAHVRDGIQGINGMQPMKKIESRITDLCREAHKKHKAAAQKTNFPLTTVAVIMGYYDSVRDMPVQIGFSQHNGFKPVVFDQPDFVTIKSVDDQTAFSILDRVNDDAIIHGRFYPEILVKRLFEEMARINAQISPVFDMIKIGREGMTQCGMKT